MSQSTLGSTLYNEILSSPNWNYRTFTVSEGSAVATLLTTDAGIAAQDALAYSDVQGYIVSGQNKGLVSEGALVMYADIYNFGSGTEQDKILLTRYAGGSYRHWALVAGFVEVGETFKGAARREIMEEVGLKVSDLVYYKSQPWSFSDSAMIGFFAKLEGDPSITLQESELGEAAWFSREDVPDLPSTISVGQEMITLFKNGGDPFCQR